MMKKVLLYFLLLFLATPMLIGLLRIPIKDNLSGDVVYPENINFTVKDWFSGHYSEKKEKYLNDMFPLRSSCIRVNNQIAFSLFSKAKANSVIVGKDNVLFEKGYLDAYYGSDFIGTEKVKEKLTKIKYIQDTLQKLNKTFILIFAAGKGSFYPEYFPDKYKTAQTTTNIQAHKEWADKLQIRNIDFNSYFIEQKNQSKYPLFPKFGIHWSEYASCLVADSIIHFIEKERNIDAPNLIWGKIELSQPKKHDYDIGEGMNLLFKPSSFDMAYPEISVQKDSMLTKPSVFVVADSYYWVLFRNGINKAFKNGQFWFYNNHIHDESGETRDRKNMDLKKEIDDHEVFILMSTTATMPQIGWGIIDEMYNYFHSGITSKPTDNQINWSRVDAIKREIKNNPNWLQSVENKALERNISTDSMITLDALWMYQQEKK